MRSILHVYIIISLLTVRSVRAQAYHPTLADTTEWCVAKDFVPLIHNPGTNRWTYNDQYFMAAGDTLLNGDTAQKVFDLSGSLAGAIYEDTITRRLYTWSNNMGPLLACDYSLNLGDTITLNFEINSSYFHDGLYTVDSVALFPTYAGMRKYIRLHNPLNVLTNYLGKVPKLEWVEGLGSTFGPMFLHYGWDTPGSFIAYSCPGQGMSDILVNKKSNGQKQYVNQCFFQYYWAMSFDSDSCLVDYGGAIQENNTAFHALAAWPNPASDRFCIELPGSFMREPHLRVVAIDVSGRSMEITTNINQAYGKLEIPCGTLTPGYYSITVSGEIIKGVARVVITGH